MKHSITIAATVFSIFATTSGYAGEKCKCRFNGSYIVEGQTACLKTPNGFSLARCEKVLNNTSWKTLNLPCPTSSLQLDNQNNKNQTPFPETLALLETSKS